MKRLLSIFILIILLVSFHVAVTQAKVRFFTMEKEEEYIEHIAKPVEMALIAKVISVDKRESTSTIGYRPIKLLKGNPPKEDFYLEYDNRNRGENVTIRVPEHKRLKWADLSIDYLLNLEGIDFLADLKFKDGIQAAGSCEDYIPPRDCSFLYNDRELSHMYDVKIVGRYAILGVLGSMLLLSGIGIWAKKANWWLEYKSALSRGGWLTVGLICAMLIYLIINFNDLFITFHEIFFKSGTWVFRFTDSLIRLFPVVFWRDAFIWVGVIAMGCGAAIGYFFAREGK